MATTPVMTPPDASSDLTSLLPKRLVRARPLFDREILGRAIKASFGKLNPLTLVKNPVMFVVEVGAALTTIFVVRDIGVGAAGLRFGIQIALWLWFTVLFANFAEAMAEARGKAQADTLRKTKTDAMAKRILSAGKIETVPASKLRSGDMVMVEAGDLIPSDGEVTEGIATVDESVITGESAPVIRESGGDRSAVTGGTRVLSDWIKVKITANPGETFLDRMIALVEGAERQKTPNEIALNILIAGLTLIFLLAVVTLQPFATYSVASAGAGTVPSVAVLVSLLVCLIPTTIGGLLSAIGIAGMDRVMQHNVLAMSGKAVEAAGDVNTLLLDKTGTITLGNRQAVEFIPAHGITEAELADAAQLSSLADETPEGRSIVVLAKQKFQLRGREVSEQEANFIPFSAYTRMSGVDLGGRRLRKGATDAISRFAQEEGGFVPSEVTASSDRISRLGGTPLAVADGARLLGVVHLKDIVKGGMKDRLGQLRSMGIRSVMITGDNPLTAAAIANEAGVDDFLAQATPEGQARVHPEGAGTGQAGGDDRRRYQRRAGTGAGRRRRGHEHRHHGGQRSREHGGPGQQSHQAHRSGGHRQAVADHARRPHHFFHRQRCGQVFRYYSGHVYGHLSGPGKTEHYAPAHAAERRAGRGDLQRADHYCPGAAGAAGGQISAAGGGKLAAPQPAHLRGRWNHCPVPGHLVDRSVAGVAEACLRNDER